MFQHHILGFSNIPTHSTHIQNALIQRPYAIILKERTENHPEAKNPSIILFKPQFLTREIRRVSHIFRPAHTSKTPKFYREQTEDISHHASFGTTYNHINRHIGFLFYQLLGNNFFITTQRNQKVCHAQLQLLKKYK